MSVFNSRLRAAALTVILVALAVFARAQDKVAYQWYDAKGRKVDFARVLKTALQNDVILFGELHNNPVAHWMQYELAQEGRQRRVGLVIAGEMFETDQQPWFDRYLKGEIDRKTFEDSAKLWPNYGTDYAPIVNYAFDWKLPVVATNIPRKWARNVFRQGMQSLDQLSEAEKALIAPLPIEVDTTLPSYRRMVEMMGGHGGASTMNLVYAQASKDATMAHFILKAQQPGMWVLHLNGAYHSDHHEGIVWYLKRSRPSLKVLTLSTVEQEDPAKLEDDNKGRADFVLVVHKNMTKTH